ncbi:MAG: CvpA family protein [Alphaproteobacteria bacterium]
MILDIVVLVVVLASALISFLRGAIREILTITGIVGGTAAAYYFGPMLVEPVAGWLGVKEGEEVQKLLGVIPYDVLASALAYGAVFIVVVIALSIVSHIMAETARSIGLGPVDRTLGVIFGIARGIVLLGVIYLPFHVLMGDEEKKNLFSDSKTFFYVEQVAVAMAGLLPEDTIKKIEEDGKTLQEAVGTREKLQNMDVLKKDVPPSGEEKPQNGPGYTEEFRDEMDKLFDSKPAPVPVPQD